MSTLTPYLCVGDGRAALAWYADALGADVVGEPILMDDGRVGHAQLSFGGATAYLAEPFPDIGVEPPDGQRGSAVTLHLSVDDCRAAVETARAAGAVVDREPDVTEHGTVAVLRDPFGHRWMLEQG